MQKSEEEFEDYWKSFGKKAWCYRLADKAEIFGRNGTPSGNVRAQPCDYVVVHNGKTIFSEVKSSQDKTAFRFSLLRKNQSSMAAQIKAAGGQYEVFLKANNGWYRIPYEIITAVKSSGKASINFSQMEAFKCSLT